MAAIEEKVAKYFAFRGDGWGCAMFRLATAGVARDRRGNRAMSIVYAVDARNERIRRIKYMRIGLEPRKPARRGQLPPTSK
ncbi:MAG: hypothetical protein WC966_06150 [Bradymonadales bacterium]